MSCENESGSVCGKNNTAMTQGNFIKETGTDWERNWRYNAAGRLSEIKDSADGLTVQNRYDPFGRRIAKTVTQGATSRTTYYINGESALMAEADEEGRITRAYGFNPHTQQARTNEEDEDAEEGSLWSTDPIWQADLAAGQSLKEASYHYLVTDHLGAPVLALNKAGETTWKANYEAFGKAIINPASTAQINLRLPGQYFDAETGLHQNWNRDYAPGIGRYVQADPLGIFGGMNVYQYAYGNPLVYYDPYGLFGMDSVWGGIYRMTGGWTPSQEFVDFSAGFGDGILATMSFGIIEGRHIRKRWDINSVNYCSTVYSRGRVTGTVVTLIVNAKGAIPKSLTHFTTEAGLRGIMKSGLRPSRFGFFGGGRYASSIGPYPKNIFVPRGSSVPFIINDTSGYLRTIPGTFLNPTTSGMLQLILMNSLYGAFANRSEFFDACEC